MPAPIESHNPRGISAAVGDAPVVSSFYTPER